MLSAPDVPYPVASSARRAWPATASAMMALLVVELSR